MHLCQGWNETEDENVYAVNRLKILQKPKQTSELLLQQRRASQLPTREMPVFEGDSLTFRMFIQKSLNSVEEKSGAKGDCFYYLERYTRGQPRDLFEVVFM